MLRLVRFNSTKIETQSALADRFSQILEEKLKNDPVISNKLSHQEKLKFESQYSKHLNYLKSENLLNHNKHAKQIANERPWDGTESTKNVNLRMIIDSTPKPKPTRHLKAGARILSAREISSEYKETKSLPNAADNEDNFRELYKERLLGPTMLVNPNSPHTTLNMVNTLASAQINSKIDLTTGRFNDVNMEKVRGKPLTRDHLANATDTNYFINQILNKQDVLPPWIENQQNVNLEIENFRNNIDKSLVNYCKLSGIPEKSELRSIFRSKQLHYCTHKVKLINASIRDYNLQSPSSSFHKIKLNAVEELDGCIDRNYDTLPDNIKELSQNVVYSNTKQGLLSLFDEQKAVKQRRVEKLQFWSSFKKMFREI
ncbi:hypothetical protein CANTEDRAFT_108198 [Yamadazyma tenuis ATCC 10573]|uniref:DnaJ homologue subfamily C member 28 conserved domain-containing protein n=2 Tax=Candida tenuis TaxID=2315449 RepID=G3BAG3_CANTC|nr:uncharacterized protein CANTEDRAFT_108198 [Yamadazyma tenuis ATCC 10573]EGV62052.1 hypothetical protein CANTEDRAFT_108198 [Yamadazyma tenuis ATCC 10573]